VCNVKVGLLGFACKCEIGNLCSQHRFADGHACTFDFKSEERARIAKANPVVVAEKIRKL
jgi:predicted nucleic acid binding AN1-type Zn finger protein